MAVKVKKIVGRLAMMPVDNSNGYFHTDFAQDKEYVTDTLKDCIFRLKMGPVGKAWQRGKFESERAYLERLAREVPKWRCMVWRFTQHVRNTARCKPMLSADEIKFLESIHYDAH